MSELIGMSEAGRIAGRPLVTMRRAAQRGRLGAVKGRDGKWYTSSEALGAYIARTQGRIRRRDGSYPGCSRQPGARRLWRKLHALA